jgi:oligoribonuclease NrnB/cAMP/cGMP phosphodiesterase (DHH superfamily)
MQLFLETAVKYMSLSGKGKDSGYQERLITLLKGRKNALVHLTHNDLDAVGSDAIHRMRFGSIASIFCSIGSFPPTLDILAGIDGNGGVLSISDLGYQKGIEERIRRVQESGWQIEWRDHHRWSDADRKACEPFCNLLLIDTSTCGCGICARDLLPDDSTAAEVARVVCDYDLWRHQDPRSGVLGVVLQRKKNRDYVRDRLVEGVFSDPYIDGEYREIVSEMEAKIQKSIRKANIRGTKYRIAFSPLYGYPSETADRMRKELSTDMEVLVSPEGRFSLRSVTPVSHIIAREFDGGGHPNAAGGHFHFTLWDRIMFLFLKKAPQFRKFVDLAESL